VSVSGAAATETITCPENYIDICIGLGFSFHFRNMINAHGTGIIEVF
jgi:hypothetical protein